MSSQTLLIDADDTLWENNVYFERAIARFISFLNHHEFSAEQVRAVLNDVERENIVTHGYGLHSFTHSLVATYERLSPKPITPEEHAQVLSFAHAISDHAIEMLPEVPDTLAYLATRFSAKEAASKAIGLGMHMPMTWRAVQTLNEPGGKPVIVFSTP